MLSWNPCAEGLTGYSFAALKAIGFAQGVEPAEVMRLHDLVQKFLSLGRSSEDRTRREGLGLYDMQRPLLPTTKRVNIHGSYPDCR
jgi:hypothetical protein